MVPAYKLNSLQNRTFQVLNLNHRGDKNQRRWIAQQKNVPLMQMSLVIKGRALNVEYSFKAELFLNAGVG